MADSLPELFARTAARVPERIAVQAGSNAWTYGELDLLVTRLAAALQTLGIANGRIALLLPNTPAVPAALFGTLRAGFRAVLLNTLYSPREVAEYVEDAGVDTIVTATPLLSLVPSGVRVVLVDALPHEIVVRDGRGERRLRLDEAGAPYASSVSLDDEAVVIYTAAQDGWARGARLSHRNLIANLRSTIEAMRLEERDRVVAALPLMHAFGLTVTLNAPLIAGATVLLVERFNPLRMLDFFEERGATVFAGVPAMYLALIAGAPRRAAPQHALRIAICGGAPLPPGSGSRWEQLFRMPLREGYGITEAGPVCLFNRTDRPNHAGTLGYPFPHVEVAIFDEHAQMLPDGEVGEICVRGDNVFLGYVGAGGDHPPELRDGWLRTGDLGSVEPGGVVRFRGVLKPMFTRNGFNIYPHELQRVLESDARIDRAVVFAQPDAERENEIVVYVQPADGASLETDDVKELCRRSLAIYKQPGRIGIGLDALNG
jgi:long-chain acyl-CoA synthetase